MFKQKLELIGEYFVAYHAEIIFEIFYPQENSFKSSEFKRNIYFLI